LDKVYTAMLVFMSLIGNVIMASKFKNDTFAIWSKTVQMDQMNPPPLVVHLLAPVIQTFVFQLVWSFSRDKIVDTASMGGWVGGAATVASVSRWWMSVMVRQDCSDGSDESLATCCPSTCPSDPDICIPAGVDLLPEQDIPWWSLTHVEKEKDCRDCTAKGSYADPGWRCNSGQCIKKEDVCNGGRGDCSDGSDESPATCCPSSCPSDPDICIQAGDKLLPGQDCRDCDASSIPNWRCNSGQCVLRSFVCDGPPHCPDGSDESPATCCPSTCPSDPDICIQAGDKLLPGQDCRDCPGGWRCNSGQCVRKWTLCDGIWQCSDGEDESPATCCASTCPSDPDICIPVGEELLLGKDCRHCKHAGYPGWRCNTGQCLEKRDVCDGIPECSDGSDETFGCLVDDVWWTTDNPPTYWEKLINTLG